MVHCPTTIHRASPDIKAVGTHGGATLFDVTISNPLSARRKAANREVNPLAVLCAAWATKVKGLRLYLQESGPRQLSVIACGVSVVHCHASKCHAIFRGSECTLQDESSCIWV